MNLFWLSSLCESHAGYTSGERKGRSVGGCGIGLIHSWLVVAVLDRDCLGMGVRETDIMEENKEVKEEEEKDEKNLEKDNDKEEINKKENVFMRVKERLSMRSKKKKKELNILKENEESVEEKKVKEKEAEKQHAMDNKASSDTVDVNKQEDCETDQPEKKKSQNIFQRLLNRFSSRSKKKREKSVAKLNTEEDLAEEDGKMDSDLQNETKSLSESSISEDLEITALCGDVKEEKQPAPSILMSSGRPPLPTMRRPPSSATTRQSRPVSQLDVALKQFKFSTAASRENLRSSRVDISQVEEQVKAMVTSRPSTPTPAGWRSRAPPENTNLADQWTKLSASLTDLR